MIGNILLIQDKECVEWVRAIPRHFAFLMGGLLPLDGAEVDDGESIRFSQAAMVQVSL